MPQLTFRCEEEFRRQFAAMIKARGMSVQDILFGLAQQWLAGASGPAAVPNPEQAGPESATAKQAHSAYPHGDEILAALGAMLARSPEAFAITLATAADLPPEHLLELRRLSTTPEKKRKVR